jgi:hypothetical protein
VRLGFDVFRTLEHHVLEQVRETGAPRPLVLRADVVRQVDVDDRRRVILRQDDPQPVRQGRHLVLQLRWPDGGRQLAGSEDRRRSDQAREDQAHHVP